MLLSLLYDSGARVQELIDLRPRDLHLDTPAFVHLTGKGRKQRNVPLMNKTVDLLKDYLHERDLFRADRQEEPLFTNHQGNRFTRCGVRYILLKYVTQAEIPCRQGTSSVSPHTLRHSKAMHLL